MVDRRVERFQCLLPEPRPDDPTVEVFFEKSIEGHTLAGLERHEMRLSQLLSPFDLLDPAFVEAAEKQIVPAADRVVPINHNSSAYQEAEAALSHLEDAVRGANDHPHPEQQGQQVAEISALRRLLQAARVRVRAVFAVAATAFVSLARMFKDKMIGALATTAWEKLQAVVGWLPSLF
jgi:hypothetical protein